MQTHGSCEPLGLSTSGTQQPLFHIFLGSVSRQHPSSWLVFRVAAGRGPVSLCWRRLPALLSVSEDFLCTPLHLTTEALTLGAGVAGASQLSSWGFFIFLNRSLSLLKASLPLLQTCGLSCFQILTSL